MIKIPKLDSPIKKILAVIVALCFQGIIPLLFILIISSIVGPSYSLDDRDLEIMSFVNSYHFKTSFICLIVFVIIIVLTCKSIIKFWNAILIITCMCTILNLFYVIIGTNFLWDCLQILGYYLLMLFGHHDLGLGCVR